MSGPSRNSIFTLPLKNFQQSLSIAYKEPLINKDSIRSAEDYQFGSKILLGHPEKSISYAIQKKVLNEDYKLYFNEQEKEKSFPDSDAAKEYVRELYDRAQVMNDLFRSHQFSANGKIFRYSYDNNLDSYVRVTLLPNGGETIRPLGENYSSVEIDLRRQFFQGELESGTESDGEEIQPPREKIDESIYWHKAMQGVLTGKSYKEFAKKEASQGFLTAVNDKSLVFESSPTALHLHEKIDLYQVKEGAIDPSAEMSLITDTSIDLKTSDVTVENLQLEFYSYDALYNYMVNHVEDFSFLQRAEIAYNYQVSEFERMSSVMEANKPGLWDRFLNTLGYQTKTYTQYQEFENELSQIANSIEAAKTKYQLELQKSEQNSYSNALQEMGITQPVSRSQEAVNALQNIVRDKYNETLSSTSRSQFKSENEYTFAKIDKLFEKLELPAMTGEQKNEIKAICEELITAPVDEDILDENIERTAKLLNQIANSEELLNAKVPVSAEASAPKKAFAEVLEEEASTSPSHHTFVR